MYQFGQPYGTMNFGTQPTPVPFSGPGHAALIQSLMATGMTRQQAEQEAMRRMQAQAQQQMPYNMPNPTPVPPAPQQPPQQAQAQKPAAAPPAPELSKEQKDKNQLQALNMLGSFFYKQAEKEDAEAQRQAENERAALAAAHPGLLGGNYQRSQQPSTLYNFTPIRPIGILG